MSLDLIDNREADASLKNTSMTHMHLSSVIQYVALCKCVNDETVSPHPEGNNTVRLPLTIFQWGRTP